MVQQMREAALSLDLWGSRSEYRAVPQVLNSNEQCRRRGRMHDALHVPPADRRLRKTEAVAPPP